MRILLFSDWWKALDLEKQVLLSMAIVISLLMVIFALLSLYGRELEHEGNNDSRKKRPFDSWTILSFFGLFFWSSFMFSYAGNSTLTTLIYAFIASGFLVITPHALRLLRPSKAENLDIKEVIQSTGKVLQYIPPHSNGAGKVYLHIRRAPHELDAITLGSELQAGHPIRVVDITDDNILLVEPLNKDLPPHKSIDFPKR